MDVEKKVNKVVEKMVEKMWMLNVDNIKMWNSVKILPQLFTQIVSYKQFMLIFIDNFYTTKMTIINLLNMSFTFFAHRTTNTTTIFNNKENKINFSGGKRWR